MLSVFETSSPSYLFLSAADGFVRSFDMHKMECWSAAIDTFYKQLHTEKLLLPPILFDNPLVYKHDKAKFRYQRKMLILTVTGLRSCCAENIILKRK